MHIQKQYKAWTDACHIYLLISFLVMYLYVYHELMCLTFTYLSVSQQCIYYCAIPLGVYINT